MLVSKNNLIITIGRENGSGGRYIGEKLAEEFGIKCYDNELITETAQKYSMDKNFVEKHDEKRPNGIFYFGSQSLPMELFAEQSAVIKEIAEKESCVFIGRASDYVLRDYTNVVNVFIHAPLEARLERFCRRKGTDIAEAEKSILKKDKERANYYQYYTNQTWGAAKNYHISIDTSIMEIEGTVEMLKAYIEKRKAEEKKIM